MCFLLSWLKCFWTLLPPPDRSFDVKFLDNTCKVRIYHNHWQNFKKEWKLSPELSVIKRNKNSSSTFAAFYRSLYYMRKMTNQRASMVFSCLNENLPKIFQLHFLQGVALNYLVLKKVFNIINPFQFLKTENPGFSKNQTKKNIPLVVLNVNKML